MMSSVAQRLSRRVRGGGGEDEGFALIYAIMLILFVTALAVTALSLVLNDVRPTEFERKRQTTLNSAQAGLDAALSQLRNALASGTTGRGVVAYLPCNTVGASGVTNHGSITGSVNTTTTSTYAASIYYFSSDPVNLTPAQVTAGTASGEFASCAAMTSSVPLYAYVISKGMAPAIPGDGTTVGDRALHVVYPFATSSALGSGGTIYYGSNCWTAPSGATVGSTVTFQSCLVAGTPSQQWYYRPDLTILWSGNPNPSKPLCLDFTGFSPSSKPIATMTLQTCLANGVAGDGFNVSTGYYGPGSTNALAYQEFVFFPGGFHDVSLVGSADQYSSTPGQGYGSSCVSSTNVSGVLGTGAAGETLAMYYPCNNAGGQSQVATSTQVGPGDAAGATTGLPGPSGQFSNNLYNNCLQNNYVPNPNVLSLALGVCGQSGNVATIGKNSVYVYSGTTTTPGTITSIRTTADCNGSPAYCAYNTVCLTTASAGQSPSVAPCTGAANQQWQLTGTVVGDYAHSYLIEDTAGNCLTGSPLGPASNYYLSAVTMTACPAAGVTTANAAQQWNGPPKTTTSSLEGLGEDPYTP